MEAESLLSEILAFCRKADMAETTFGRRAVNDGKFVGRLKYGGKVTTATVERVRAFIAEHEPPERSEPRRDPLQGFDDRFTGPGAPSPRLPPTANFRFYDTRQKYLMFVNTCSEKQVAAQRVAQELETLRPRPPALRVFDAGVGDGAVLARAMRSMHRRFPTFPFYIVGKEISLEDVRLTLEKMADRFYEHAPTCLVMTNLAYAEAPWLLPHSPRRAQRMVWKELALKGDTAAEFEEQIAGLHGFLAENWRARVSRTSGMPVYETPSVLVIFREDHRFLLDPVLPRRGAVRADYDLVIASQPYRARASIGFKVRRILAPLARSLAPGGRLLGIHSCGGDPGLEIIQRIWPGEQPFQIDRHTLLRATKSELGRSAHHFNFTANSDAKSLFRFDMHTLPGEIDAGEDIGASTLLAAWNAATYVAQIEDARLAPVMEDAGYLRATRDVLRERGGLWFFDESYVISRKRDL